MNDWLEGIFGVVLTLFGGWWGSAPPNPVPPPETSSSPRVTHTVAHVIDGDTIILANGERVRLLGIDTPEREECYYEPARAFLREWIDGATVQLESDVRNRDDYDRLLRYVFVTTLPSGDATTTPQLVNDVLLQRGYATILPIGDDRRYRTQFRASYDAAQAADRGRWQACDT